jgi:N6-adenosine-specific RNA methylase IME4
MERAIREVSDGRGGFMKSLPKGKYSIIYADPPWQYKVWSKATGLGRSAESHYNTMTKAEIQNLPVNSISEDNSVLFLWVTAPCLLEGIELITKWGFEYKTIGFTWVKRNKKVDSWFWGMGYYTRANTELCLLATKGKPLKRISKSVHQVVDSRIRKHSQKPDEVRDRIVQLFGDLPRIELFAREQKKGWIVWGDEV